MPPKRKKNATELRKALRDKDAKMKESEAKLAFIQADNENSVEQALRNKSKLPKKQENKNQ